MEDSECYTREELASFGFTEIGHPVWISRKSSFYAIQGTLGHHVRVDDFCVFKGRVTLGNYVHVCAYTSLSGVRGRVDLGDCSSLGNRVSVYTGTDDFHADSLNSNLVPQEMVSTLCGDVRIGSAAMVGAHCVVMPGVSVGDGAAVGALCVISQNVEPGAVLVSAASRCVAVGRRDVGKIMGLVARLKGPAQA